jgi:hypothetical protein
MRELGVSVDALPFQNPLPETTALIAFPFYQIHNLNPVGYLGYLYFLEFLPTGNGGELMDALERSGVPRRAMRFLQDHSTLDVAHNRLMESYVETLITNERELASAIYAMRVTGNLYARMIEAAFLSAEQPTDYGLSTEECEGGGYSGTGRREEKTEERVRIRWEDHAENLPPSIQSRRLAG